MEIRLVFEIIVGYVASTTAVIMAIINLATSTNRAARWFQRRLLSPVASDIEAMRRDLDALARDLTEIAILGQSLPAATRADAAQRWLDQGYDGLTAVRARALIDTYREEMTDRQRGA